MVSSHTYGARGTTWRAALTMLALTIIGVLHVNILGRSIALSFLPIIGVCLWPRYANPVVSIVLLLAYGLIFDLLTFYPLGLTSLIYLTLFAVFRPDLRIKPYDFSSAFIRWCGALILGMVMAYFLGWLARSTRPDMLTILFQAFIATALFPIIYALRNLSKILLRDVEDRGL